ncbi:MAG: thiamine pyrophosphate-dependent enzyme [Candidatus Woesearchaeota archaeon]
MVDIKEFAKREVKLVGGHRLCAGCPAPTIAKLAMMCSDKPVIVSNATGCLEVSTTIYPYTAWKAPWIHTAFENTAANIAGVESAFIALKRKGLIDQNKDFRFMAIAGDGGTYDIGLQALSGAIERGHKFVYICYDNEAYSNTGIQRSSATPLYANTTTDPVGSDRKGKQELRKDFTEIMVAHNMQYIAQTALSNLNDFIPKVEKAFKKTDETATFVNVFSPCIPGWGIHDGDAIMISKIAVDTCFWPLYEVENGVYTLNYNPESLGKKKPIIEFLKLQSRFKHLLKPENAHLVEAFQHDVDTRWEKLKKRCGI